MKHNPQNVGKDHKLEDEDVIQIVKRYVLVLDHRPVKLGAVSRTGKVKGGNEGCRDRVVMYYRMPVVE